MDGSIRPGDIQVGAQLVPEAETPAFPSQQQVQRSISVCPLSRRSAGGRVRIRTERQTIARPQKDRQPPVSARYDGLPSGRRAAAGGQTIVAGGDRRLPVFLRAGYGLALRSDANSAPGAPAGERADGNAPLHLLLAGECGRFRFRDELGTDLDITWSDGAVHIEGDYRFPLTWEVLPVEEC